MVRFGIIGTGKIPPPCARTGGLPRSGCPRRADGGRGVIQGVKWIDASGAGAGLPDKGRLLPETAASCKGIWHDNSRFA